MAAAPLVAPQSPYFSATAYAAGAALPDHPIKAKLAETRRDDNGLFYIGGTVGQENIRFLVDTGASHVILSHADARRLGTAARLADRQMVMTAGGPVAVDWIVIKEIDFDGHRIRNLKAAIPRRDVGLSLLGQNALAQFDSIHIDGDRLRFER